MAHRSDYFTYFCIVKQINSSFKIVLLSVCLLLTGHSYAQTEASRMDSITISLLTVGAGDEVWSLYGHTAIRFQDSKTGQDLAANYGSFSFDQPFFVARFVFGLTDYELAIYPMSLFMEVYREEKRWVLQQTLNLTAEEKQRITNALYENYLPQNRTYRYNYFYDNCTTRARDILLNNLNNITVSSNTEQVAPSYREMTHQWNENHLWDRFGNDLLLGIQADFKTTYEAREFLPDSLRKDFESIMTIDKDGRRCPLVSETKYLYKPEKADEAETALTKLRPLTFFATLLILTVTLTGLQWRKKRNFWVLDSILLSITGLAGLMLLVMVFSQHPTVRINLQILLLNPLSLIFLYPTIKAERKGLSHWYWKVLTACLALFFIGAFWQDYAEGMLFLALCLLVRCMWQLSNAHTKT